ncbi:MAG: metallophosphoesterase [Spirochaetia bacterium]|jgi:Icc protein
MRFIHITDTHIAADPAFIGHGHAPLQRLEALVQAVNALTFSVDFVLHTGDLAEDRSEGAYVLARSVLARLRLPVHYVAGNHDDADILQKVMLGRAPSGPRFDYRLSAAGVMVAVFDSRGPRDPAGTLTDGQLDSLREICAPEGPPLVIAVHHPPLPLDSPWLDAGWATPAGQGASMLLDRGPEFLDAIIPARDRIRGVFFGHVHRAFQVAYRGILFSSAPSGFVQFQTWPDQEHPDAATMEQAGFSIVTIHAGQTTVRHHSIPGWERDNRYSSMEQAGGTAPT